MRPPTHELTVHRVDVLGPEDAAAWDALASRSDLPSPFLRSWWLGAVAGRGATFLLVREGAQLVGGLALQGRRLLGVRRWQLLGQGKLCPDHLDLVADPVRADRVGDALHTHLTRPCSWVLDLDGLRDGSRLAAAWTRAGDAIDQQVMEHAPFVRLPGTYEEYVASRSRNFRQKARKITRRAEATDMAVTQVEADHVPWALDQFEDLNLARGDRKALLRELPRIRRAIEAGVASGEAEVHVASRDGLVAAVSLVLTGGGAARNYQTVRSLERDLDGAAMLTHLSVIASVCARGHREFDFLRGGEAYKYTYTDDHRPLLRARSADGAGHLVLAAIRIAERARPLVAGWLARLPGHSGSTHHPKKV